MKLTRTVFLSILLSVLLLAGGCSKDEPKAAAPAKSAHPDTAVTAERDIPDRAISTTAAPDQTSPQQDTTGSDGAPKITMLKLEPVPAFPGSTLTVVVTSEDPDDDLVTYSYQWLRNDEPVDGEFEEFDTTGFSKGDLIAVMVTPSDGELDGKTRKSLPLLLHDRPPEITSIPTGMVDGRFVYQVEATDPDGDTLSYSLEGAPAGMEIDPESGLIDWQVPADLTGAYQVKILATDGDAKSYQSFSLTFRQQ